MTLAEDLAVAPRTATYGAQCRFCTWFKGLSTGEQDLVLAALDDNTREGAVLDRVWEKHGWRYTRSATQRHRRYECSGWASVRAR